MKPLNDGKYKNRHGKPIELWYDKESGYHVDKDDNFYTDDGTCMFWSTDNERFFMNTDPKSDLCKWH